MINTYPEDKDISLEFSVLDAAGESYSGVCVAKYSLFDTNGDPVTSGTVENVETVLNLTIGKEFNQVADGQIKDLRFLRVTFYTPEDELISEQKLTYLLNNDNPLVICGNSFVSFNQFRLIEASTSGLSNFSKATDDEIVVALVEAHDRLCRLRYRLPFNVRMESIAYVSEVASRPRAITDDDPIGLYGASFSLDDITQEEYAQLPEKFRKALEKAQVLEADNVLAPTDTIEDRRKKGVILETINEVKMMFSNTTPVSYSVSSKVLSLLAPYLDRSVRCRRVG